MTSSKPYLIRAIYEWLVDNNLTPYITIDTTTAYVDIPQEYTKEAQLTLDISTSATSNLLITNEAIEFKARFGNASHNIYIPMAAVMMIFAQENDRGMAFAPEEFGEDFIDFDETTIDPDEDLSDTQEPAKSDNKHGLKLL